MSTRSPQELLAKFDLYPPSTARGRYYVPCPKCSAKRSTKAHRQAKCLRITIDDKGPRWGCSHCGWTGPSKSNGRGPTKANGKEIEKKAVSRIGSPSMSDDQTPIRVHPEAYYDDQGRLIETGNGYPSVKVRTPMSVKQRTPLSVKQRTPLSVKVRTLQRITVRETTDIRNG